MQFLRVARQVFAGEILHIKAILRYFPIRNGRYLIECNFEFERVRKSAIRLPGTGGGNDISSLTQMIVAMKHEKRRFVEKVDFITSPGFIDGGDTRAQRGLISGGMWRVVTDLALLGFDETSREMRVLALHPGVAPERVQESTGFDLHIDKRTERDPGTAACCATSAPTGFTYGTAAPAPRRPPAKACPVRRGNAQLHALRDAECARRWTTASRREARLRIDLAWDHILTAWANYDHRALSILTAIAAREIKLGIGVLVMPMRSP